MHLPPFLNDMWVPGPLSRGGIVGYDIVYDVEYPFPSPDGDNFHCGRESPPVARRREFCCRREFLLPLPDSVALEAPPPIAWRQ